MLPATSQSRAREDFTNFLSEIGWTDAQIHQDMAAAGYVSADQHFPEVEIRPSEIDGIGCFAVKSYRSGDRVCLVRFHQNKTMEGRFINHSGEPNVRFVVIGEETHAFALRNIDANEEVVVDYRQALSISDSVKKGDLSIDNVDSESIGIDSISAWLSILPQQPEILKHDFTDGIYARQSTLEAGSIFTTETHKIDHPFALTEGEAYVWSKTAGWRLFKAPMIGVTRAGTRRFVLIKSRCVMTTFHPNPGNETDLTKIWDRLYVKRQPPAHMTTGDLSRVHRFMQAIEDAYVGISPLPALAETSEDLEQLIPIKP